MVGWGWSKFKGFEPYWSQLCRIDILTKGVTCRLLVSYSTVQCRYAQLSFPLAAS